MPDLSVLSKEIRDLKSQWLVLLDLEAAAGPGQADAIRGEIERTKMALNRLLWIYFEANERRRLTS